MSYNYPTSNYYEATAQRQSYPVLQGDITVDVCVVGGGIAGCSTALHLAQRGYRVALIESHRIGHGASGRSGGQLLPGYSCGQQALKTMLGDAVARQLWDLSVEAVALATSLINKHNIHCDLKFGHITAAIKQRHRDELLRQQDQLQREYYYPHLRMIERSELQSLILSERYIAGLQDSAAAHIHPLNFTLGLSTVAHASGALLFEGAPVTNVEQNGQQVRINTSHGAVIAKQVVLCANVENIKLTNSPSRIMPVTTYVMATDEIRVPIMNSDTAVSDCNYILDYFRMSQSRLLFGGGVAYSGNANMSDIHRIHQHMLKVFPQLRDAKIEHAWHGLIDISRNRAPDFGRVDNNIYYLQGFSGHGLALATLAGKLVAESIAMQNERFDLYARIPHEDFPGGILQKPLLIMAMLWYRLRDVL